MKKSSGGKSAVLDKLIAVFENQPHRWASSGEHIRGAHRMCIMTGIWHIVGHGRPTGAAALVRQVLKNRGYSGPITAWNDTVAKDVSDVIKLLKEANS